MQYRTLGRQKRQVSILGFGAMRFSTRGGNDADVDTKMATSLLHAAIDGGVNYIDTAYVYHGGTSEQIVADALAVADYRDRAIVATKLPVWNVEKTVDFDRLLDEQLKRLRTDRIDFYLLHCLQGPNWADLCQLGLLEWCDRAERSGKIGELGFSFHDRYEVLEEIVSAREWSFCQVQYNIVNEHTQGGTRGVELLRSKGVDVVVMEPLLGGTLATPPAPIAELYKNAGMNPVDLSLRWLWENPAISLLLSGMNSMDQLHQNLAIADRAWDPGTPDVGRLTDAELALIGEVQRMYEELMPIACTKCRYCVPLCPQGVAIPDNLEMYSNAKVFGGNNFSLNRNLYWAIPESQRASSCVQCGECMTHCPQQLPIPELLGQVVELFH